jgi:glutamine synthetase
MTELEYEAILLGIPVHTRHNETAPAQFEIAPLYEQANLAVDHQMLLMQLLRSIALRHGFLCLLHEKPFTGINGSAKHNNWSMMTDEGENLLEPGETPHENAQFLFFMSAVLRAVHLHGDLLRISVSGAGNDHRLGADEAPPAIMSMFLGGTLGEIFHKLATGTASAMRKQTPLEIGVSILPPLKRHSEDRNRTSPFAFTGNKFEFRAVGASHNVARSTTVLNAIVTESLDYMAGLLEKTQKSKKDFHVAVQEIVAETIREHQAVLFSGNCYSEEWKKEAKKRGLSNLMTTAECLPLINSKKAVELFSKYHIFSEAESNSRREIYEENYIKTICIEADTAIEIASTMILPAVFRYKSVLMVSATTKLQKAVLRELDFCIDRLITILNGLKEAKVVLDESNYATQALPAMQTLRVTVDDLETMVDDDLWPMPTYTEMLFSR